MEPDKIFNRLWNDYITRNPSAKSVFDLFESKGEKVVNDHIAFRTFNDPRVGIDVLSGIFLKAGYAEKGKYTFREKNLRAKHFELEGNDTAPKVFISELILEEFHPWLKDWATGLVDRIPVGMLGSDELIFSGTLWGTPSFDQYEQVRSLTEYGAWLYVNGFRANHFTVHVNYLNHYPALESVNKFLKENGFQLNDSGGEIKGTAGQLLRQSSTKAGKLAVAFREGVFDTPGCYYEFAQRYPDNSGKLYNGFIAASADKIFESTDQYITHS